MHLYLIDGNNLLPKITGLSLSDPDDADQLLEMLQDFSRLRRQKVEIFFESAPPELVGPRTHGVIRAHYLPKGQTAAAAIRLRLEKLGPLARETLVVTSERRLQSEARAQHAPFLDAELFARELMAVPRSRIPAPEPPAPLKKPAPSAPPPRVSKTQPNLSTDEVSEWMDLFKGKKKE